MIPEPVWSTNSIDLGPARIVTDFRGRVKLLPPTAFGCDRLVVAGLSMLTATYFMLRDDVEYRDLGPHHFDRRDRTKSINRLVRRLQDLGCEVEVKHAA